MRKVWIICSIFIIFFCGFYIFQVNALARELAEVEESVERSNQLKSENEKIETDLLKNCSLESLESNVSKLNFEKVNEISYIKALQIWVAVR